MLSLLLLGLVLTSHTRCCQSICYDNRNASITLTRYKGRYLMRRIPHASNGSFNPFAISNEEAHIVNGNVNNDEKEKQLKKTINERDATDSERLSNPNHFRNYCLSHAGKCSCAVDCFLQRVNISGSLSMGNDKPKEVLLKSSGQAGNVKEDCVLEDETGTSMLHIWEPLLSTLKNGDSYLFTNLTVKNFQGTTFLSTSPLTTTSPSTTTLKTLSGPEMLKSPEKEVTAKCIDLVAKLNIFCSCTVCKKKLNDAESFSCATLKCGNCGTRQRAKSVKRQATVRLCITDSATKEEIWIQAFSDHIEALLVGSDLSLRS